MDQIVEFANNNLLLVSGTVAMALAVAFYELRLKAGSISGVSTAVAVQLINQGARVVDIRDQAQFEAGHIVDAINLQVADLPNSQDKQLKKAKSIILVCDNGTKSGQAVAAIKRGGTDNAFCLSGGMTAWQRDNLPVVSAAVPAAAPLDDGAAAKNKDDGEA